MSRPLQLLAFVLFVFLASLASFQLASAGWGLATASAGFLASGFLALGFLRLERRLCSRTSLGRLNQVSLGLLLGLLLAAALSSWIGVVLAPLWSSPASQFQQIVDSFIYLFSGYLGVLLVIKGQGQLRLMIPFIDLQDQSHPSKELFLDFSVMQDPRLIDLAATGLLDGKLVVARYLLEELQERRENSPEEVDRAKARRSLELLAKLELLPHLQLRYLDDLFSELKDPSERLLALVRHHQGQLLVGELSTMEAARFEGVELISMSHLSKALKPLNQTGELIQLKIQHYGKGARQGVGYLEDGTMVVVNGGADFIGSTISAQVLSVKHTSSGRMIFSNALEDKSAPQPMGAPVAAVARVNGSFSPAKQGRFYPID